MESYDSKTKKERRYMDKYVTKVIKGVTYDWLHKDGGKISNYYCPVHYTRCIIFPDKSNPKSMHDFWCADCLASNLSGSHINEHPDTHLPNNPYSNAILRVSHQREAIRQIHTIINDLYIYGKTIARKKMIKMFKQDEAGYMKYKVNAIKQGVSNYLKNKEDFQ